LPIDENGDETMVKQVTAEINREDEIEEGDPPVESTSAVRNTIIIDNIEYQEVMPEFSVAVQTRAQAKREVQSIRPLKMTMVDELNLTPDEFKKLQEDDKNLKVCWDKAKDNTTVEAMSAKGHFEIKNGFLYRKFKPSAHVEVIKQLVVPTCLEQKVISYAHDTVLSSHGSISSTFKKMSTVFYMKGGQHKCRVYVKSCLLCQKGGNRSVGGKAKMLSMPQSTEPFDRVYIDLVGEIHPPSAEGHRYILCGTDSCSHFPFAVPLKRTDSVTIAEALLAQFSIFGHPRVIVSDNASNLTSSIIEEIYRVYGIRKQQIALLQYTSQHRIPFKNVVMPS